MNLQEITKSSAFVATVFGLVVALLPFGLEQIGETTGLFSFPVTKTIRGWFVGAPASRATAAPAAVDWARCRRDLESFTQWAEDQRVAVISLPREPAVIHVKEQDDRTERTMWSVPVVSCTAADPTAHRPGYVFISGFEGSFAEGMTIAPSEVRCGYEIVFVGERSVWLRAVFEPEGDMPMGVTRFPEFTRIEGECLVRGNRKYVARDAFPLGSGGWLMLDSFLPPDGAVFKILDEGRHTVASLLCVVLGERGGR